MKSAASVGDRVALQGDHPHAGYSGRLIRFERVSGVEAARVRLDDGFECFVFESGQLVRLQGRGGGR